MIPPKPGTIKTPARNLTESPDIKKVDQKFTTVVTHHEPKVSIGSKIFTAIKNIRYKRYLSYLTILWSIAIITLGFISVSAFDKLNESFGEKSLWETITSVGKNYITGERTELKGEKDGRTNILILGEANEGGTDTIIILSYYHKEKKFVTVTIPRDLYIADGYWTGEGQNKKWIKTWSHKINGTYTFAKIRENRKEKEERTEPAIFVKDLIEKEWKIPLHYWAVVNFNGVKEFIELFHGVDVDVERSFTDCTYPDNNFGYLPCQKFVKGTEHMDGERSLIYSRSRHGNNGEGSDFARSKRQSNVIQALMSKAKSEVDNGNALTINNINGISQTLGDNLKTSMELDEMISFYSLFKQNNNIKESFYKITWENGNGFLYGAMDESAGSIITYVDGTTAGSGRYSSSRAKAISQLSNLLEEAKFSALYKKSVVVLGNGSDSIKPTYKALLETGFTKNTNGLGGVWPAFYNYKHIDKATKNSQETVTFYIQDDVTRKLFQEMAQKEFGFQYTVEKEFPEEKIIDKNNKNADIITWIESVKP